MTKQTGIKDIKIEFLIDMDKNEFINIFIGYNDLPNKSFTGIESIKEIKEIINHNFDLWEKDRKSYDKKFLLFENENGELNGIN